MATSVLGLVLLIGLPIVAITGLLSNNAYQPNLGGNVIGNAVGRLSFDPLAWPTQPSWLYAFTQGLHVAIGLALVPVLLAKLWSVLPRLFEWPVVRSPAHALERLSLVLLVGSAIFEFVTGIIDIQLWVPFGFYFPPAHYYGGLVFIVAFVLHAALKLPTMRQGLKLRRELSATVPGLDRPAPTAGTRVQRPERERSVASRVDRPLDPRTLPPDHVTPCAARDGRRRLSDPVGQGAGESIGGVFRSLAFLPPNRMGSGPNGFPVTHTAAESLLRPSDVDASWRLVVVGEHTVSLTRPQLLAMTQYTYALPIACVEGWVDHGVRGPACAFATWRRLPGPPARRPCKPCRRRVTAGTSTRRRSGTSRSPTSARCSRCGSTASTCRSTTATRGARSARRCRAFTAPSGWSR